MEPINELAKALAAAQGEMRGAAKDAKNPHFKSDYATLASVIETARPVLAKHGLAVVQLPGAIDDTGLHLTTILMHASGQNIRSDFVMPVPRRDPQGVGSAITYARRYALMSVLGIPAEDDDGNAAQPAEPVKAAKPKADDLKTLAATLAAAVDMAVSPDDLAIWQEENDHAIKRLPDTWQAKLREKITARFNELTSEAA